MTITKDEARRVIEIAQELISDGTFTTLKLVRRVRDEIPEASSEDLEHALDARIFDIDEEKYEGEVETQDCKRALRIIKRASQLTGDKDMTILEAARVMAEKHDPEAVAWLKEIEKLRKGHV